MIQPVFQFMSFLVAQMTSSYDGLTAWMLMSSSIISHTIFNFVHVYIYQWTCGLPAATPRQVASARSQAYRFYRTMAEPTFCNWRERVKRMRDKSHGIQPKSTGRSKGD